MTISYIWDDDGFGISDEAGLMDKRWIMGTIDERIRLVTFRIDEWYVEFY